MSTYEKAFELIDYMLDGEIFDKYKIAELLDIDLRSAGRMMKRIYEMSYVFRNIELRLDSLGESGGDRMRFHIKKRDLKSPD